MGNWLLGEDHFVFVKSTLTSCVLAPGHLRNPKDMVSNEITARLRQIILLADFAG